LVVERVNCVCGGWDRSSAVADLAEENDNYSVARGVKELLLRAVQRWLKLCCSRRTQTCARELHCCFAAFLTIPFLLS